MDKQSVAERLRALATDDQRRSKAARLRDVLDDVEMALAAGARRADVLAELEAQGLRMSLSTFETTLKRLRANRRREPAARRPTHTYGVTLRASAEATVLIAGQAKAEPQPSHDPADLDRIIATQPDLTALARLAKRSKK
jgi:hypothetical protein